MTHAEIIRSYLDAGLSIIPIKRDGSKAGLGEWGIYMERLASEDEMMQWIKWQVEGWGLVCGAVSGNVEVTDLDDPALWEALIEQIDPDLLLRLVIALTPSGGRHLIYRCETIEGNQKLARRELSPGKVETLIETRGEGGMILVYPTVADYHPANKPYQIIQGDLLNTPTITPEERASILNAARLLNEYFPQPQTWTPRIGNNGDGTRPGDDFAEHTGWDEILEPHGWRAMRQRGDKVIWQRPGKDGPGGSAQTGGASARTGFSGLYVYSTNALPLESDRGYGKFSAYAALNYDSDYSAAAKALADEGWGKQVIVKEHVEPERENVALVAIIASLNSVDMPRLPDAAYIDPERGRNASPWLSAYATLSRQWSPRAFEDFHTACGLWLLSTVAARRVVLHLGGPRYSNLYIALIARSSLWAKSTTAKIVTQTLGKAGLSFMLAPDDSTPQRFIADLVRKVPDNWQDMDYTERALVSQRLALPASRGWFYEEFGQKIDAMLAPGGFMSEFRGILRAFDDCPETYQYASIGRGLDEVQQPYIAMLGNMTPADLRRATRKHDALWQDGFWARWAFITPPASVNSSRARFPLGQREIPSVIYEPIQEWHQRLGMPELTFEERFDDKGKGTGAYDAYADPVHRAEVTIDADVLDAFYAYHDGLLDIVEASENRDLNGNYARFAEKALRIGILVTSLENHNRITMPVWALAQSITERWRQSLHELYTQANEPEPSEAMAIEDRAYEIVEKLGEPTAMGVGRYLHMSSKEAADILDGMVSAGKLLCVATTRRGTRRYSTDLEDESETNSSKSSNSNK